MEKFLHIQLDANSGVPMYRQVMDQVKYYRSSGALKSGDKLPSIRALSQYLSINPTTVVKAYGELEHEGVIEKRHGKGVFILDGSPRKTVAEQKKVIGRLARQLAVEAKQLGADKELVRNVLEAEMTQAGLDEEPKRKST